MGKADQLAKRIFTDETGAATGQRMEFEVPPEVPVGALAPDGVVKGATTPPNVEGLPDPWRRLRREAVIDIKMPGDHIDRAALARCELRRFARWARYLEQENPPPAPDPVEFGAWVVTSHVPRWLREDAARGVITLERVDPGIWRVGPRDYDALWIAANELPLRVELLPFLVARSGRAMLEFAVWALSVKGPAWVLGVLKDLPMGQQAIDEIGHVSDDPAEQHRIRMELIRVLLQLEPEAANDLVERGMAPLLRQCERKLSRPLTDEEHVEIVRRLDTLGPERLGDVVLDLDAGALKAWLADPHAR